MFINIVRDISFLYDVPKKDDDPTKPNKRDPSFIRASEQPEPKQASFCNSILNKMQNNCNAFRV
jgi:hypothetical protein